MIVNVSRGGDVLFVKWVSVITFGTSSAQKRTLLIFNLGLVISVLHFGNLVVYRIMQVHFCLTYNKNKKVWTIFCDPVFNVMFISHASCFKVWKLNAIFLVNGEVLFAHWTLVQNFRFYNCLHKLNFKKNDIWGRKLSLVFFKFYT